MVRNTVRAAFASMMLAVFAAAPAVASQPSAVQAEQTETLNVNTANAEELSMIMVGVGVKRAEQIIKLREQLGGFTELEQLLDVKGIGLKTLEKNRPLISLD